MDEELQALAQVAEEAKELRRLMNVAFQFIASKRPEEVRVDVLRANLVLQPALAR